MNKFALVAASAILGLAMAFTSVIPAYAASKVDCDAVMKELSSGKKVKEVATDMKISTSSVYRCRRHAREAAKSESKTQGKGAHGREAAKTVASSKAAPSAVASPEASPAAHSKGKK